MNLLTRELLGQLEQIQIPSRRRMRFSQRGERTSLRKGASLEFSDYREYLQGDDIRRIDWNVYARTERLFLKLFLEEESKAVYFIVDGSESMNFGSPTKFEYAMALAASLSFVCLRRYDHPSIFILHNKDFLKFSFPSQRQFFAILQQLEKQSTGGDTFLSLALRKIAFAQYPRGIYFLLSDFFTQDGFEGMKILEASGNELNCLHVLSPEEIRPTLRGDLRLIDSETADTSEVSISPQILRKYSARLNHWQRQIMKDAHRNGAYYHTISTSVPLPALLLRDLRKTGILL